jgi:hypothetical protein
LALLNAVRQDLVLPYWRHPSQTALINAIYLREELRSGRRFTQFRFNAFITNNSCKETITAKAASEQGYIWPISRALSLNKLMTDN